MVTIGKAASRVAILQDVSSARTLGPVLHFLYEPWPPLALRQLERWVAWSFLLTWPKNHIKSVFNHTLFGCCFSFVVQMLLQWRTYDVFKVIDLQCLTLGSFLFSSILPIINLLLTVNYLESVAAFPDPVGSPLSLPHSTLGTNYNQRPYVSKPWSVNYCLLKFRK